MVEANESPERAGSTKDEVAGRFPRNEHVRAPDRWGQVFGEATIASAMIDRIVHHADVIALKGASYRIKHTAIESLPSVEAERQADSTP